MNRQKHGAISERVNRAAVVSSSGQESHDAIVCKHSLGSCIDTMALAEAQDIRGMICWAKVLLHSSSRFASHCASLGSHDST